MTTATARRPEPSPGPEPERGDRPAAPPDARSLLQDPTGRRRLVATLLGLLVGGSAYLVTLLDFSRDLTRTALAPGYFSHFFDLQARALLDGHLWVPDGSLGIEGFVHGGHTYTYFPPFPALLRLPVLLTTHEYDARLTVVSMMVAWVVLAVVVTKLAWLTTTLVSGSEEVSRLQATAVGVFLAGATGGTFLTYDAGQPWVYHEVYIWAVTAAIGSAYWLVRVQVSPDRKALKWLFVFALVAVGSRATEGWAVCLVVVAMSALWRWRPATPEHRRRAWLLALAGLAPLAVSITINWLKFRAIYMFPLKDQVWTQISEQRQAALAANGGSLTGPQFFTTSFMAYLRPDGIRFVDYFPWITLPAHPAPAFNGAVVDQSYRTGSATAFMPLFMILLAVAVVAAFRPGARAGLRVFRWPLVVGVLVTGGVMAYGYYSTRYTSEFVPALVVGGALGTALVASWVERRRRAWAAAFLGLMTLGVLFSLVAQVVVGTTAAALIHRGAPLERYLELQHAFSPAEQAKRVKLVQGLPRGGTTDDIAIRGNCQALYLHTGDQYEPWLPVQERDRVLHLDYDAGRLVPGEATLFTVDSTRRDRVDVQVDSRRRMRLVAYIDGRPAEQPWFDVPTTGGVSVGIRNRIDFSAYQVNSSPGGTVGYLPSVYLDQREKSRPSRLTVTSDPTELDDLGLTLTDRPGLPLDFCNQLARTAGLRLGSGG